MNINKLAAANTRSEMGRKEPPLKIKDFSKALGYSEMTGSHKYHGKTKWNLDDLAKAAKWLKVEPTDLIKNPKPNGEKNAL